MSVLKEAAKYALGALAGAAITISVFINRAEHIQSEQISRSSMEFKSYRHNSVILRLNLDGYETGGQDWLRSKDGNYWFWTVVYKKCGKERVPTISFSTPLREDRVFERFTLEKCATKSDLKSVESTMQNYDYKPVQYVARQ